MVVQMRATEVVYKTVGGTLLKLHLYLPNQLPRRARRAAIIFFHGGGFVGGHPAQFFPHCQHFAELGLIAASAEYRLLGKAATSVGDCLADSKSAIRWLRAHAGDLHLHAVKVVAGGGSSGGNLAANAAMVEGFDAAGDDLSISPKPDALVLLTPALFEPAFVPGRFDEHFYTIRHIRPHLPPMLILHGGEDEHFPLAEMEQFRDAMVAAGNRCDLQIYQGGHGFFNHGRDENRPYHATLQAVEQFLASLSFIP